MISPLSVRSGAAPRVKSILFHSGFYSLFRRALPSRHIGILRYHAICDPDAGYAEPGICISPAAFERHAAFLAAHYAVLPLPEAVAALKRGSTLPGNAVAITFDDGYADNLEAARTLARFGLTATFYITAGCLADGQPFWPAEIRTLIAAIKAPVLRLTTGTAPVEVPLVTEEERRTAIRTISRLLKSHPIAIRESLRQELRSAAGGASATNCMLTWREVVEMDRLGMTIGSHTLTHPNLPSAGERDARTEICDSKVRLERELGKPVTMFSYPNGGAERYVTPEVKNLVRDAGFEAAATSRNAFAGPHSDVYALERVQVQERLEDLAFALEIERFAFKPQQRPGELDWAPE